MFTFLTFFLQFWDKDNETRTMENTILEFVYIWDTDYYSDNWEPEFMIIFVTWQSIVTLDSIHNSCNVFFFTGTPQKVSSTKKINLG